MGGKGSKVQEFSQEGLRRFEQNFQLVKSENDPRFDKIKIYQERSSGKYIGVLSKYSEDPAVIATLKEELGYRVNMTHSNIAKVVGYTTKDEENLCGRNQVLDVYFEWFDHDLELEILERKPKKDYFSEAEIQYMAKSLINAGAYMQQNGIYNGDIRPLNVMMNEEGQVLLTDHGLLNAYKDNYNKGMAGKKDSYLTPIQLEYLRNKSNNPNYDQYKSDVFSLGMTLIYACNLDNPIDCYDFSKKVLNRTYLENHLQAIQNNYSPQTYQLIRSMVELDDAQRPDFNQLAGLSSNLGNSLVQPPVVQSGLPLANVSGFNQMNQSTMLPMRPGFAPLGGSQLAAPMSRGPVFNPYGSMAMGGSRRLV